jgi:hypothetical protein
MAKEKIKTKPKNVVQKNTGYIISNPEHSHVNDNLQLLRITVTNLETKVDFGYQATSYYTNGGWIKISPKTFIRPKGTNKKLILTNATNIPYGPEKLHFNSSIEWRYFSLHFPSILDDSDNKKSLMFNTAEPIKIDSIDLIENEKGDSTDFNFYGIRLDDERKKSLIQQL